VVWLNGEELGEKRMMFDIWDASSVTLLTKFNNNAMLQDNGQKISDLCGETMENRLSGCFLLASSFYFSSSLFLDISQSVPTTL
jgi:hypothetical protein